MDILLAHTGSYPRIGDDPTKQKHRSAHHKWERGEITDAELERISRSVTEEIIQEQIMAGCDLVTDGQVRWHDPISHLTGKLEGVTINGLLRFFDTNFYFRQPIITKKVRPFAPLLLDEFRSAQQVSRRPVKPVMTGPYTLAKLSILATDQYRHFRDLVTDLAEILADDVAVLAKEGAPIVQVDEPAILKNEREFEIFRDGIEILSSKKGGTTLALYTYFGDAAPLYQQLHTLPVDILGFDFTYSPRLTEIIGRDGSDKILGLGLIDGRNTRSDPPEEVLPILEKILPRLSAPLCYINPSCGLEYLPRDRAFKKLCHMRDLKNQFESRRTQ